MELTPIIAVHMSAALAATALGPFVLWARLGRRLHPRLHRGLGYAWVTLMVAAALSAIFISSPELPNLAGFSPIHLLIPVTLGMLVLAFVALAYGRVKAHRKTMLGLYLGACVVAGGFTLLPGRYLGQMVWGQWLGLLA